MTAPQQDTFAENECLNLIRSRIWSDFYSSDILQQMIGGMISGGAKESLLRAAIEEEFQKKVAAEKSWPLETDCDRLNRAFEDLKANGIVALQFPAMDLGDGLYEIRAAVRSRENGQAVGYCFYLEECIRDALAGSGLDLICGRWGGGRLPEIAHAIEFALTVEGFRVDRNSDSSLHIHAIDWKRRTSG